MLEKLIQIGFNEDQAQVYLACLKLGKTTISRIVTASGVSKKLCYKALDFLINEGYIETFGNKKKHYAVTNPDFIGKKLKEKVATFDSVLPSLYEHANEAFSNRCVTTYTNNQSIRNAFKKHMRRMPTGSTLLVIESPEFNFVDFMNSGTNDDFDTYETIRKNRDISVNVLFVNESNTHYNEWTTQHPRFKHTVRVASSSTGYTLAGMYVWHDRAFLLTKTNESILLIELANKDIKKGFETYFQSLWEQAKVLE